MNTNLFKVTYPSGLVQHVWDDAKDVGAFVMKTFGKVEDELEAFGAKVEHVVEDVIEKIEGAPTVALPTETLTAAVPVDVAPAPVVEEPPVADTTAAPVQHVSL